MHWCTSVAFVTNIPDDDAVTAAPIPEVPTEAFARLRMKGERFDGAHLPVDALVELQRYQALILKAASLAWQDSHSGEELPSDFADGAKLVIVDLEEGSAVSVLELPTSSYGEYFVDGREELEREFEVLETWLARQGLPHSSSEIDLLALPLLDEPEFAAFGSSFGAEDEIVLWSPTTQRPIEITEALRSNAFVPLAAERARLVSPPVLVAPLRTVSGEVAGKLFGVNAESKSFEMRTVRDENVRGKYLDETLTADLKRVLDNTSKAPVVRVTGKLRYRGDVLKTLVGVTEVKLLEIDGESWSARFIELASLDNGWDPDNPDSRSIAFPALDAAREILTECKRIGRKLPGIFPMEDGGVQLEWASASAVTSIEITPEIEFALFDLEVASRSVNEEETSDLLVAKEFVTRTVR
jgi:hypothetical protein